MSASIYIFCSASTIVPSFAMHDDNCHCDWTRSGPTFKIHWAVKHTVQIWPSLPVTCHIRKVSFSFFIHLKSKENFLAISVKKKFKSMKSWLYLYSIANHYKSSCSPFLKIWYSYFNMTWKWDLAKFEAQGFWGRRGNWVFQTPKTFSNWVVVMLHGTCDVEIT